MARPKRGDLVRTNVHLDRPQIEELDGIADETGTPRSELIRDAIASYLKNHRRRVARA